MINTTVLQKKYFYFFYAKVTNVQKLHIKRQIFNILYIEVVARRCSVKKELKNPEKLIWKSSMGALYNQ